MIKKVMVVFALLSLPLGIGAHKAHSAARCGAVCPNHQYNCQRDAGHSGLHVCPKFHVF
jgi:hypothetical protein